jgi:3-dehydroquinate synthase
VSHRLNVMTDSTLRVDLGERSYDIAIVSDAVDRVGAFARLRCPGRLAYVVTDVHVAPHAERIGASLHSAGFRTAMTVLPAGERQKALSVAGRLVDDLLAAGADRHTVVVAVGGGVVGDLAGFVASIYARGLALFMVPTTLLAMVDSSVGGKVAVNHPQAKNLIGTFHQPIGVWIDTQALATLPDREYRSGLAEVVKYGVVLEADFFAYLEANVEAILRRDGPVVREVIGRCCRLKAEVVQKDERERSGHRAVLNYGHTFAHAIEAAAIYGTWLHGEAVAAGMNCAARLARNRGLIGDEIVHRQERLLGRFGLPPNQNTWPDPESMLGLMHHDKKSLAGQLRFVLPRRLGEVALFDDVPADEVLHILREVPAGR